MRGLYTFTINNIAYYFSSESVKLRFLYIKSMVLSRLGLSLMILCIWVEEDEFGLSKDGSL